MSGWMNNVRGVEPYVPGEQPAGSCVKLNTNENPFPPSPGVAAALRDLPADALRLYPDPASGKLTEALARRYQVKPSQVFVGVGSDDVLAMSFLTFFNGKEPILFADVTYSFYEVWADCFRIPYRHVPLREDWTIDPADYAQPNGGIVIANPNAPTGLALPLTEIRKILEANRDVVVIVDEAYVDFGGESAAVLLPEYDNLLVVQTFSKSRSMAGMRIGFAIGGEELIRCLSDVRYSVNSYTLNLPAQIAGAAALEDEAYFQKTIQEIITTREDTRQALAEMGFACLDSKTNFLFVTHPKASAQELFQKLRERRIFVRYFARPRTADYLRITIGTKDQMTCLTDALREIMQGR